MRGQFKLPSEASDNIRLTEVCTDYFALDGIFWQPKYNPTPLLSCYKAITWLQTLCWMHLALTWALGLVLGLWYYVFPFHFCTLYCCLPVSSCYCLLSLSSILCLMLLHNQHTPHSTKNLCLFMIKIKIEISFKTAIMYVLLFSLMLWSFVNQFVATMKIY